MKPHLSILLAIFGGVFLYSLGSCSSGGVTLAYCKNTNNGKWRRVLSEMLTEIPFYVNPVDCGDVGSNGMAVVLRYPSGLKYVISQAEGQSEEEFLISVIRKLASERIIPVEDSLEKSLSREKEAIVVFTKKDTKGVSPLLRALFLPGVPKEIKIFQISSKSLLPSHLQQKVYEDLHIWVVTSGEWSQLKLPYSSPNKIHLYIARMFRKLHFSLTIKYETDDVYGGYHRAGFNFITVYHHTDQLDDVYETIINPLVNVFRPYFVFVAVNIDEYKPPHDIDSEGPFPYIVITLEQKKSDIHISSQKTQYTIKKNMGKLLESLIDPEIDYELEEDSAFVVTLPDRMRLPDSLPTLTAQNYSNFSSQNETCIIGFYLSYSVNSKVMLIHLSNANELMKSKGISTAVVNCAEYPDVCQYFDIYQYPTVKYRSGYDGDWTTYQGVLSDLELIIKLTEDLDDKQQKMIVELTPSLLLKNIKSEGLSNLLILSAEKVTPELQSTLSGATGYQIFWLNSTRYSKISEFLIDQSLSLPPVLVWADYRKGCLYCLDLNTSLTEKDIAIFIRDIINGSRSCDTGISPTDWKPFFSPIKFPSAKFLDKHQKRVRPSSDKGERNRKVMGHSKHLPHNRHFDQPKVPDLQKQPHSTHQEL